jgi:hypothetical protein
VGTGPLAKIAGLKEISKKFKVKLRFLQAEVRERGRLHKPLADGFKGYIVLRSLGKRMSDEKV